MKEYNCEICNFNCSVKRLYNQHLKSIVHKIAIGEEDITNYEDVTCHECGNIFKSRSSLWRHKKICLTTDHEEKLIKNKNKKKKTKNESFTELKDEKTLDTILREVLNETRVLKDAFIEQTKTIENLRMVNEKQQRIIQKNMPLINSSSTTTNHITNVMNNNFNINVFLNEKCKDAINLSEFIQSITVQMEDLDKTKNFGFVKGITDIIVKNLRQLDIYRRPIHCSDPLKEIMYIKNDNNWLQENEDKPIVRGAINAVAKKQLEKVKDWEEHNNVWQQNEKGTNDYIQLVKHVTCTEENEESKIIKNLVREVTIK